MDFNTVVVVAAAVKPMAMAAAGWTTSALLSIPQLGVYDVNVVANKTVCESIFRRRPISHRQAYLTFISLVVFFIPSLIMLACYVRIFTKISSKAGQTKSILSKEDGEEVDIELASTAVSHSYTRILTNR